MRWLKVVQGRGGSGRDSVSDKWLERVNFSHNVTLQTLQIQQLTATYYTPFTVLSKLTDQEMQKNNNKSVFIIAILKYFSWSHAQIISSTLIVTSPIAIANWHRHKNSEK